MARALRLSAVWCAFAAAAALPGARAQSVAVGGVTYSNLGLVGLGRVADDKKDKLGETLGSFSGLALDLRTWQRSSSSSYTATLYTQPDRGYTKSSVTTNYRPRRQKFTLTLTPDINGSSKQTQLDLALGDTTLYTEASGTSLTSLDPSATSTGTRTGFPTLPQAASNGRIALDAEGIALLPDGTFFVSDEYGPYLYRFSAAGVLLGAIRPPEALIPKRNGQDSFSSDSPGAGQPNASPSQPTSGRENNKGFEGLSLSADGRTLYALMQSATRQDGGSSGSGQNRYARLLAYDVSTPAAATLTGEWVLPLPLYTDANKVQQVAEQHELVTLGSKQFLVIATDGLGRGADSSASLYRAVLVFDTTSATNIAGTGFDSAATPLAPGGVLASSITPATSGVLVDLNDTTQLKKFGLNNSSNSDSNTLASKWESLALAPVLDATAPNDFFLFVGNDNDFSTSDGFQDGTAYNASPGIDSMILVYRVTLPGTAYPPVFTTQPTNRSANPGQTVTFTAAASGTPTPTYQWSKNGTAIAGATNATLILSSVQAADAGSYTIVATNAVGSTTSSAATLSVSNAPVFLTQPAAALTIATGGTVVLSANASGSPTPTYQWKKDGVSVATGATLVVSPATAASAGSYVVVATNASGSTTSTAAVLTVVTTNDVGRLSNLSVLTDLTTTVPNFTVGTVVGSGGAKPLVVRAVGPSLGALGVPGTIADPQLALFNSSSAVVATNDNWKGDPTLQTAMASVGAFAFTSADSKDAATFQSGLSPGNYSVLVSGVGGSTGTVIAEIYDATPTSTFTASSPRLTNVSVLKQINANGAITLGFTVGGSTAKTVLIRAIGPGLAAVGVSSGTLADPQLTLFNSGSAAIASNDDWGGDAALTSTMSRVNAFAGFSNASKDAMLLVTLPPGGYTAQAGGVTGTSGLVIVEVYDVP